MDTGHPRAASVRPAGARAPVSDVAFTPTVKAIQQARGSRRHYEHRAGVHDWESEISEGLKDFIEAQTSVFLATANAAGQPYIQHRGGPPGFLKVLDNHTIGFVDFAGNRQYISTGNLSDNDQAHLFLIDYSTRQRVKIWGRARVVEKEQADIAGLMPPDYRARAEQVILFTVTAWDVNCPQHIPLRLSREDVTTVLAAKDQRIAALEAELAALKGGQTR